MQKKQLPQTPEDIQPKKVDQQYQVKVTNENAAVLSVHFLQQIYARLGYIIKLLEKPSGK
jgi:hypothetical protein